MKEMLIMVAAMTPTELLVEKLEEAISKWKAAKTDEIFEEVAFAANLILLKKVTEGKVDGAEKLISDIEKLMKLDEMFKPNEN